MAFLNARNDLKPTGAFGGVVSSPPCPAIALVAAQAVPGVNATTALDAEMVTACTPPAVTVPNENPQRAWKNCAARANPGRELSRAVNEPRLAPIAATTSMTMIRPTRSPMMVPKRSPAACRSAKLVAESHDALSAFQPSRMLLMVSHPTYATAAQV